MKAIILATDETRPMKPGIPKAQNALCGVTLLEWARRLAASAGAAGADVAYSSAYSDAYSSEGLMFANEFVTPGEYVLIIADNLPLLKSETLARLCDAAQGSAGAYVYANDSRINAYCFNANDLLAALSAASSAASTRGKAIGLADILEYFTKTNRVLRGVEADVAQCQSVNDLAQLAAAASIMRMQINERHMQNGVTLLDPTNTYIDADVTIGQGTLIHPGCSLEGKTSVGENCEITQSSRIVNSTIGANTRIQASLIAQSRVGTNANVGPFVHLRPDSAVGDDCRVGNFVEIKNSNVSRGAKVPHLSYIGDGDVGENTNIGCGVIFSNYDGVKKHRTVIGRDCFIGCNTNLVPPVSIGDNAFIAAGSTITKDVPAGALGVARARQVNKEGWKTARDRVYRKE